MQFRVGVMVLGALIVTATLLVMFGRLPAMLGKTYTIQVHFNYAGGVANYTPVRKSGILIGRVSNVQLTEKDTGVLVTAEIQGDKTIYRNEECYISRDLLGDTALAFVANPRKQGAGQPVDPNAVIEGRVSDDPTGLKTALEAPINTVVQTGQALTEASNELKLAARKVSELLDSEQRQLHDVLENAAGSLKALRTVIGDPETQQRLAEAVKKMPDTLDSMNETFRTTNESLRAFTTRTGPEQKTAVERMVGTIEITERALRRFTEAAEPGKRPPAEQIALAMENIGEITTLMRTIMGRIEQGEGSLGALLNDRQLYDRLNRAARNVEQVSRDLKPIVDDARVFSDKVSRHPGVIIRDAIKPGAGIK